MPHPLVDQFKFTRREWRRSVDGLSAADAEAHVGRMNSVSWIVGHLAWHEQRTFLTRPQNILLYPQLNELFAYGAPTPAPTAGAV